MTGQDPVVKPVVKPVIKPVVKPAEKPVVVEEPVNLDLSGLGDDDDDDKPDYSSADVVKVENIGKKVVHVKSGPLSPGEKGEATIAEAQAYYQYIKRV